MTTHSDRDGTELNRFTSPQETTGATPAPLGTSVEWHVAYCPHSDPACNGWVECSRRAPAPAGLPLHESADRDADAVARVTQFLWQVRPLTEENRAATARRVVEIVQAALRAEGGA